MSRTILKFWDMFVKIRLKKQKQNFTQINIVCIRNITKDILPTRQNQKVFFKLFI